MVNNSKINKADSDEHLMTPMVLNFLTVCILHNILLNHDLF